MTPPPPPPPPHEVEVLSLPETEFTSLSLVKDANTHPPLNKLDAVSVTVGSKDTADSPIGAFQLQDHPIDDVRKTKVHISRIPTLVNKADNNKSR